MTRHPIRRRLGRFIISDPAIDINPDAIMALFGKIIVLRAEAQPWAQQTEYLGISPLFGLLAENTEIPIYQISIASDRDGYRVFATL